MDTTSILIAAALGAAIATTNSPPTRPPPVPSAALFPVSASRAVGPVTPELVTLKLTVNYPAEELSPDIVLRIYATTNANAPTWQVLTNLLNGKTNCFIQVIPEKRFYTTTSYSVYYDRESPPGPVASTPAGPRSDATLTISRP
jgi:hypothetical protein